MVVHSWDAYEGDALGVPVTASRLGAADGEVGSGACDGLARTCTARERRRAVWAEGGTETNLEE